MKELLEKILGQIKKTPEGVRAYEDLYHTLTKRVVRRLNVKQSSLSLIPRWKHSVSHEPL